MCACVCTRCVYVCTCVCTRVVEGGRGRGGALPGGFGLRWHQALTKPWGGEAEAEAGRCLRQGPGARECWAGIWRVSYGDSGASLQGQPCWGQLRWAWRRGRVSGAGRTLRQGHLIVVGGGSGRRRKQDAQRRSWKPRTSISCCKVNVSLEECLLGLHHLVALRPLRGPLGAGWDRAASGWPQAVCRLWGLPRCPGW